MIILDKREKQFSADFDGIVKAASDIYTVFSVCIYANNIHRSLTSDVYNASNSHYIGALLFPIAVCTIRNNGDRYIIYVRNSDTYDNSH